MPLTKIKSLGITDGTIAIADLSATGTPSSATFLRGDNTWGSAGAAAGQVIQVVNATDNTLRQGSASAYATLSNTLSVTITPSSTANKVFIICHTTIYCTGAAVYPTIFRGATNIGGGTQTALSFYDSAFTSIGILPYAITVLDSPSTTSATTYQIYVKAASGNIDIGNSNWRSSITAFEIKG